VNSIGLSRQEPADTLDEGLPLGFRIHDTQTDYHVEAPGYRNRFRR